MKKTDRGTSRADRITGTVKRIIRDKGFGFIADDQRVEYFFHRSAVQGFEQLTEGVRVTFVPSEGEKGPRADQVEREFPD